MFDTIIRGGSVVDGTGAPARTADVAISGGIIVEIGRVGGRAQEVIEADGALVTPGFIDVHTHYDGQFLWDDKMDPSFSHGVTTAIAGNCGVGFAPVQPEFRQSLVELMEGVEDIPGIVLDEGLDWNWRSFGDYLDRIAARHYSMDVGSQITHAPVRVAVMGERALRHEAATPEDISAMSQIVRDAMAAGAFGFSGARLVEHVSTHGLLVPGTFAEDEELFALAKAMGEGGHGIFQTIPLGAIGGVLFEDIGRDARKAEHDRIARIAAACGRPVTYSLIKYASDPTDWRMMLDETARHNATGLRIHPQVGSRPAGVLTLLEGHHPFRFRPSYVEVAHLPLSERVIALRDPARRAAILSEEDGLARAKASKMDQQAAHVLQASIGEMFAITLPIDYEPEAHQKLSVLAAQAGVSPTTYLYDHLTTGDGSNIAADNHIGYSDGNLDAIYEMLNDVNVISGLGDGGAHLSMVCDASFTTTQLTFWARDRTRGPRIPVEAIVAKMTKVNADAYGMADRGVITEGKRADINVIDFKNLDLDLPRISRDMPSGGRRLLQKSSGYLATMVNGTVTRRHDTDTGAKPGRLLRSHA